MQEKKLSVWEHQYGGYAWTRSIFYQPNFLTCAPYKQQKEVFTLFPFGTVKLVFESTGLRKVKIKFVSDQVVHTAET